MRLPSRLSLSAVAAALLVSSVVVAGARGQVRNREGAPSPVVFRLAPSVATAAECAGTAITGERGEAITFSRSSSSYCTKSDGTMVLLSSDKPRVEANGLLVEASATNTYLRSSEFDSASWTKAQTASASVPTVTADAAVAPDGTTTADEVTFAATNSAQESYIAQSLSCASTCTQSVYVKGVSGSGTIDVCVGGLNNCTPCSYTSTAWTRCTNTRSVTATVNRYIGNASAANGNVARSAADVYLWGAQMETGAFATSYIATAGTQATRSADVASVTKPAALTDTAGCLSATIHLNGFSGTGNVRALSMSTTGIPVFVSSSTAVGVSDFGVVLSLTGLTNLVGRSVRVRSSWEGSTKYIEADGSSNSNTYDGTIVGTPLYLGSSGSGEYLNGHVSNVIAGTTRSACQ